MDWILKDNMVDGLFFCATLTDRRGGHIPFVQIGAKRPTSVQRRLSRNQALLGSVTPGGKCGALWGCPPTPYSIGDPPSAPNVCWRCQDEVMPCCAAGTNGCLDLRRHAFALDGRFSTERSRCPGSMARPVRDSVAPLRRILAGWVPARIGWLSVGVGRRHPVTIRKASLMEESIRRVWALRHQTGAQYSEVECTRARVAIRRVVAPAPQPEPASRLRSATRDVSFLRSDSKCWRYSLGPPITFLT